MTSARSSVPEHYSEEPASASGIFRIGGELPIHRLGFGAMRITGKGVWGEPHDRNEAIRVLRRTLEPGINFIDTADSYGPEVSEQLIAEALHPYPKDLVIATKAGFDRSGPGQWTMNGNPKHLREACEGSLRRLKVERIDLYQLHRIDPHYPADDQFGVFKDLQSQGKIRYVGLSEVTVDQIEHAQKIVPVVTVQNRYSLADRSYEGVLDHCGREKIGFIPWNPINAGDLNALGKELQRVALHHKITTAQVALAWLLWRSPVMLPIPGTSRVVHLEENVAAATLEFDDGELEALGQEP
jgi:aryl-alcohol dehydrogenase-like predicted oxidoreductase